MQAYYRGDAVELPDGTVRARCRPNHIRAVIEGELAVDWHATLAAVACPTLLIRARGPFGPPGAGPILSAESARRAIALIPDARLIEVDGNHVTFVFAPAALRVTEAIRSFLLG